MIPKQIVAELTLSNDEVVVVKKSLDWYRKVLKESTENDNEVYPETLVYDHLYHTLDRMRIQHVFTIDLHIIEAHYLMIALSLFKEDSLRMKNKKQEMKIATELSFTFSDFIRESGFSDVIYSFEDLIMEERIKWLEDYYKGE